MKKIIFLILTITTFYSFGQNLTCKDFKKGKFYIPIEEVDTLYIKKGGNLEKIVIKNEENLKKYIILRKEKIQIEWENELNKGEPTYEKIKWLNHCKYSLQLDETKHKLDENDKFIIENGGLIVEVIEIKNRCMKYKASVKLKNGDEMFTIAFMCKE